MAKPKVNGQVPFYKSVRLPLLCTYSTRANQLLVLAQGKMLPGKRHRVQ
jgi:hypothetical protein